MSEVIAKAIREVFISPNVPDSNFEDSNVVDAIARLSEKVENAGIMISEALITIAKAIAEDL